LAFIYAACQVDHYFAGSMVIHNLEFADVSVLHHDGEKANDYLGRGSDNNLKN